MYFEKYALIFKDNIVLYDNGDFKETFSKLNDSDKGDYKNENYVRVKLVPKNNDPFCNIRRWEFILNRSTPPTWFDYSRDYERTIQALQAWADACLHIGEKNLVISSGKGHFIKNCNGVTICGSAHVKKICGNTFVRKICGFAVVELISGYVRVNKICEKARVYEIIDCVNVKRITNNADISRFGGQAKAKRVDGKSFIYEICDAAKVDTIGGRATVLFANGYSVINKISFNSSVQNLFGYSNINCVRYNARIFAIYEHARINDTPTRGILPVGCSKFTAKDYRRFINRRVA